MSLNPSLIGLSLIFHEQVGASREIIDAVNRKLSDVIWFAGGHVATFSPVALMNQLSKLEFVVRGEGEQIFIDILKRAHSEGKPMNTEIFSSLPGATLNRLNYPQLATPPLILDLNTLPFPIRDSSWSEDEPQSSHFSVIGSRGCYARCDFCSVPPFFKESEGAAWRLRSAKNLVEEIQELESGLGATHISFLDDVFLARDQRSRERAKDLAQLLIDAKSRIRFSIECRADAIDYDIFRMLKDAGLARVFVGIEAGEPETLRKFSKDCSSDVNVRALDVLRKLKIPVTCGFILFHPDATVQEIINNIGFAKTFGIGNRRAVCSRMDAYPGTPIWSRLRLEDRLYGENELSPQYTFLDPFVGEICVKFRRSFESLRAIDTELLRLEFELTKLSEPACTRLEEERNAISYAYSTKMCDLAIRMIDHWNSQAFSDREFGDEVAEVFESIYPQFLTLRRKMEALKEVE